MKKHPRHVVQIAALQKFGTDFSYIVGHVNHPRRSDQNFKPQGVDLFRTFDKMCRRVNMRTRVGSEMKKRNIGRVALRQLRPRFDIKAGSPS
jgi:hypothetical protein